MRSFIIKKIRQYGLMPFINKSFVLIFKIKKKAFLILGKSDLDAVYSDSFFKAEDNTTRPSSKFVVDILYKYFKPKSVIDIGCGTGIYLNYFKIKGVSIFGMDGSKHVLKNLQILKSEFKIFDLREKFNTSKRYDVGICFEVAEHIEPKYSSNLVDIVTKSSDLIIFTAAPPGQGGTDHLNEQPRNFWIKLFKEKHFEYDSALTKKIAAEFIKNDVVWYLPKNLFIFKKIKMKTKK